MPAYLYRSSKAMVVEEKTDNKKVISLEWALRNKEILKA
jgi:hypothetical protein